MGQVYSLAEKNHKQVETEIMKIWPFDAHTRIIVLR